MAAAWSSKFLSKEVHRPLASANEVQMRDSGVSERGLYARFTSEQKVTIGKRAAEHSVAITNRSLLQKTCATI